MVAASPSVKEPRAQNHDSLASALFKLHLDRAKFAMDNLDHPLNLFGSNGTSARLLTQQVHHVSRKLTASLQIKEY